VVRLPVHPSTSPSLAFAPGLGRWSGSSLLRLWVVRRSLLACCYSLVPFAPCTARCISISLSPIHAFEVGDVKLVLGASRKPRPTFVGPTTSAVVGVVYLAGDVVATAQCHLVCKVKTCLLFPGEMDDGGALIVLSLVASSGLTSLLNLRRPLDVRRPVTCMCSWSACCQQASPPFPLSLSLLWWCFRVLLPKLLLCTSIIFS
jgi:hypothetical protein